ncbi:TetR/AcrR family transcriptional regulator [Haloglycomyces albus]|uniref:TetR/AcrR family transcriptional regulator n=1 Tax=Haloglycomyces albus TaxID=526067 RepID=UPI00046D4D87|nr:TetR/AcrR family transcriptional regulator [Haloglycomyces albus]
MASRSSKPTSKDQRLGERDWVEAANDILVEENVRGIKLDRLCRKLGVTKGSFYWHFKKRAELLTALLADWRKRMTLNTINQLTSQSNRRRLANLLKRPRHPKATRAAAIEVSIRDWARRDPMAAEALTEVDTIRLEFFKKIFIDEGFAPEQAHQRAYLAYCLMMGDSVINKSLPDHIDQEQFTELAMTILFQNEQRQ